MELYFRFFFQCRFVAFVLNASKNSIRISMSFQYLSNSAIDHNQFIDHMRMKNGRLATLIFRWLFEVTVAFIVKVLAVKFAIYIDTNSF